MDNFFGIGLPELVVILVIAGMVMGPERIARSARTLGALTARLQGISRSFMRQLNAELDAADETGQIRSTVEELDQLRRQVAELRNEVFTLATGTAADSRQAINSVRREVENSIRPPDLGLETKTTGTVSDGRQVNRPPSLALDETTTGGGAGENNHAPTPTTKPAPLPKRLDVPEDPDA